LIPWKDYFYMEKYAARSEKFVRLAGVGFKPP
jgi:hypothetical protein